MVFEAGLFGGALGMRRTFILHAKGAKLPTDLLGMTAVRYPEALTAADMRDGEPEAPQGDRGRGSTDPARGRLVAALAHPAHASASRRRSASSGSRAIARAASRSPAEGGRRTARSRPATGARPRRSAAIRTSVFYFWNGERPRHPNAPQLEGTGEIRLEDADRASGYWTTRSDTDPSLHERTSGVYLRADPDDMRVLDGDDPKPRAQLIARRLREWKAISNS